MSRRLFVSVVVIAIVIGALIGYIRGLPSDFVENPNPDGVGYRCGDGTEFMLVAVGDDRHIIPQTSVDYVSGALLKNSGTDAYTDGTTTIVGTRDGMQLKSGDHASTTCYLMGESSQHTGN